MSMLRNIDILYLRPQYAIRGLCLTKLSQGAPVTPLLKYISSGQLSENMPRNYTYAYMERKNSPVIN